MNVMELKMKYIVAAFCFLANVPSARSQADSLERTGWRKYWNSLIHGNVDRTFEKKLDMSFVVVPCYTREGSFGIGGAATALYRLDRRDSTMQPSDFSLSGSASIRGVYTLTAKGNNNFRGNKSRLPTACSFSTRRWIFGVSRLTPAQEIPCRNTRSGR